MSDWLKKRGQTGGVQEALEQAQALCGEDLLMWVIPLPWDGAKLIVRRGADPVGEVVLYLEAGRNDIICVLAALGVDVESGQNRTVDTLRRGFIQDGMDPSEAVEAAAALVFGPA